MNPTSVNQTTQDPCVHHTSTKTPKATPQSLVVEACRDGNAPKVEVVIHLQPHVRPEVGAKEAAKPF